MIICRASCKITKNLSISCQGAWECVVVCGKGASPSPTVCESALSADYYYYKLVYHLLPIDLCMHQVDMYMHQVDMYRHQVDMYIHQVDMYRHQVDMYMLQVDMYMHQFDMYMHQVDMYMHQVDTYAHPVDGRNIPPAPPSTGS